MHATFDLATYLTETGELHEMTYQKNEVILRPDSDNERFFLIRSGLVKAYTIDNQGQEEVQLVYAKGEAFPVAWMAAHELSNLFFEAMDTCELSYIARPDLVRMLNEDVAFANCMLRHVVHQFVVYAARVHNLSYKYSRERLAYRLLLMAKRFGTSSPNGVTLPPISQQEIGATINLSRESVNRELGRFERLGILLHRKGRIVIVAPEQLRKEIKAEPGELYFDL